MTEKVEPLYFGDMRLQSLHERIEACVDDLAGTDIPVLAVVGVLESVKADLLSRMRED